MEDFFEKPREGEELLVLAVLWLCTFLGCVTALETFCKQLPLETALFVGAAYFVSPYAIRSLYGEFRGHRAFKYLVMFNFFASTAVYLAAANMVMAAP